MVSDVRQVLEHYQESTSDRLEAIGALIETVRAAGQEVVLVLDDTDKWTRALEATPDEDVSARRAFFSRSVRVLDQFRVAVVVSVHSSYLEDAAWEQTMAAVGVQLPVPRLRTASAVQTIVNARLTHAGLPEDLIDPSGIDAIFAAYQGDGRSDIRMLVMSLGHQAAEIAAEAGAERITDMHVNAALVQMRIEPRS